jgi:sucrose-6-phosphate hydrolase SacC (GH32 family)
MYSGSAVVDKDNTSGFGADGKAPMVLIYTAAGSPHTQCVAYSTDGRTFMKYAGNPVVPWIGGGNRDPQVFWYEPTKQWVMVVFVDGPVPGKKDVFQYSVHILTSPNLRDWTPRSIVKGGMGEDYFLAECPNLFPLPVDGDPNQTKWVLMGAYCSYVVGTFDGKSFSPETSPRSTQRGYGCFQAPQIISNEPHGRVVQIGWLHAASPGMPFNQCMSVPRELTLQSSPEGPRLCVYPVKELEALRGQSRIVKSSDLQPGSNALADVPWQVADIDADLIPGKTGKIIFNLLGKVVIYDAGRGELIVDNAAQSLPLVNGAVRLRILIDRTSIEIYGANGLVYVPLDYIPPQSGDSTLSLTAAGEPIKINALACYEMNSIWQTAKE